MNHFAKVHEIVAQQRLDREAELLPLAHQRRRIAELEATIRDLIAAGDSLKISKEQHDAWHGPALRAQRILNGEPCDNHRG